MQKKNISSLLVAIMFCAVGYAPAFAQEHSDRPTFTKHYVAQNDQSESEEDQNASEDQSASEGGQEESEQQAESSGGGGEPAADLSSFLPGGGGGGGRVSLATLFVQAVGMGIMIVFLVSIPISFTCLICALIWKIGMVARGGKKPDIG